MLCVGNLFFTSTSTNHEGDDLTCVQGDQNLRGAITANPSDARSSSGIKTYLPTVSSKSAAKQWWVFHHQGSWPGGVTTGCCEKKRKDWFWGCLVTEESIAPRPMISPGGGMVRLRLPEAPFAALSRAPLSPDPDQKICGRTLMGRVWVSKNELAPPLPSATRIAKLLWE